MRYAALNNSVIVQLVEKKDEIKSGIVLTENQKENSVRGRVISFDENFIKTKIKKDDIVYFDKRKIVLTLEEVERGENIVVLSAVDLLAVEEV